AIELAERALVALDTSPRNSSPVMQQRDVVVQALAASHALAGNHHRALHLLHENVDLVEVGGSPARLAEALCWLAEASERAGDVVLADRTARRVLQIAAELS